MMFGIVYHNFKGKERIEEGKKKPPTSASKQKRLRGDLTNLYLAIVSTWVKNGHPWKRA